MARGWISGHVLGFALAALVCAPVAEGERRSSATIEASMEVSGRITIERDGSVSGWELDQPGKLPLDVVELVEESLPSWRFEPVLVDGAPVRGSARMRLHLQARPLPDGGYGALIGDAQFGRAALTWEERKARGLDEDAEVDTSVVTSLQLTPPEYPEQALRENFRGTVHLAVRVNRAGGVDDAVAEQVNLRKFSTTGRMDRMRDLLGRAAVEAARGWTFRTPTTGELAEQAFWTVRITVDYAVHAPKSNPFRGVVAYGDRVVEYGQWQPHVAGPRNPVLWEEGPVQDRIPYALAPGRIHQPDIGPKLLTPLAGD